MTLPRSPGSFNSIRHRNSEKHFIGRRFQTERILFGAGQPIFAHLQRGRSTIYLKSNKCEELINTRSLGFESSKSNHRRRNNRGLKFGKIWYFSERYRDYIFSFLDVGANIFHNRIELHDITEESWKFHLNPAQEFRKALYRVEVSNGRNSFWRWTTP